MEYGSGGYGTPSADNLFKVTIGAGEIVRIRTVLVYPTNDIVRMHTNARLLCGQTVDDINAFQDRFAEIRDCPY